MGINQMPPKKEPESLTRILEKFLIQVTYQRGEKTCYVSDYDVAQAKTVIQQLVSECLPEKINHVCPDHLKLTMGCQYCDEAISYNRAIDTIKKNMREVGLYELPRV